MVKSVPCSSRSEGSTIANSSHRIGKHIEDCSIRILRASRATTMRAANMEARTPTLACLLSDTTLSTHSAAWVDARTIKAPMMRRGWLH